MLIGINQRSKKLLRSIQVDGCLFLCFAQQSPLIFKGEKGINALNYLWMKAAGKGVIDDTNTLIDHSKLAQDFFALNVDYDGIHHDGDETIPDNTAFVIGKYMWHTGHFVLIDKNKKVIFDPLGESYTVKNGALQSMRYYYAKEKSVNL